jgi:putative ABC transport system substrate-binding protein
MKRFLCIFVCLFFITQPVFAGQQYRIAVLQVSKIQVFENAYEGFIETLKGHGIVEGDNLTVSRYIIDADLDANLWEKVGILLKIKKTAGRIINENPDLVLTIGTPATKYSKDKIIKAGIPLVFTCVANPIAAGCESMTQAGPGWTGATIYIDPYDVIKIARLALPKMRTMGIIHCDDDNAVAFAEEAKEKAAKQGIRVLTRQVGKSDKIAPAAKELIGEGIDMFGIPPDTYYALRDNEPARDLVAITHEKKIPGIAFMTSGAGGCILYIGPSLRTNGSLSGEQAAKILIDGVKPGSLPIARQENLSILSDTDALKILGIEIPLEILQLAKPFTESS